jgi:spore maturation protein CgeB
LGPEEAAFYQEIIDYFRENPDTGMTEGISRFFLRDFPHIKKREMRDAVINSIFIDLYMRFYFRGAIVKSLVEHGFPLELYGSGWDRLLPEPREGLVLCGPTDTRGCLQAMSRAKVSLNVMPWFKEGAHDRFYSGMLCGSVMVSDSSQYLKETLPEGACLFELKEPEGLLRSMDRIFSEEEMSREMAEKGQAFADKNHRWTNRTDVLLAHIKAAGFLS